MNSRVAIFAVAEKANCSISTVSNVLNNKGRVSPEKRKLVLRAAETLGYKINAAGRTLRTRKSEMVGLWFYPSCLEVFKNPFYAEVVDGVEERLTLERYHLVMASYRSANAETSVPDFVVGGKVDGMILLGRFPDRIIQKLFSIGCPLLCLDFNDDWPVDNVVPDGFSGGIQAVDCLTSRHHRRIVMVASGAENPNVELRIQGFLAGLANRGIPGAEENIIRDQLSLDGTYQALRKRLKSSVPPTAIFAATDTLATWLIEKMRQDGILVPEKVSVIGYDDEEGQSMSDNRHFLTSIQVDRRQLGRMGAEVLLKRVSAPGAPLSHLRSPVHLVNRNSVADLVETAPTTSLIKRFFFS